ncbi:MAG: beta-lactamase family protein [Clostridia bacterium]|nr:beta-lactamase family protein [Clostridia bacterium]
MRDFSVFLQSRLEEGKATGCFPCAAAAIGVKDMVLAQAFTGEAPLPGDRPVDEHTRFDMASLSKVLGTTMVALKAIEAGNLRLDDTVGQFFPQAPADKKNITIFMLMTHTGGFNPSFRLDQLLTDPRDAVNCILHYPLDEHPGVRPIYSCMGYILLAKILEEKFGKPLKTMAKEQVFDPLGMTETGYCPPSDAVCAATEVNAATGKPWIGVVHDENARFLQGNSGNAGVFMPLCDGVKFAQMLSCGGKGLLKEETLTAATRNYTPGQDAHRGLGFQIAGTPDCFFSNQVPDHCFGHTGFTGTSLMVEPDTGFWVLLLTNRVYPTRNSAALFPFRRHLHGDSWHLFLEQ